MGTSVIEAHVPLANMFGYSTELRSNSQGKAEYTMEFERYEQVPRQVQDELIKKYASNKKG
jgi:elongation factor G